MISLAFGTLGKILELLQLKVLTVLFCRLVGSPLLSADEAGRVLELFPVVLLEVSVLGFLLVKVVVEVDDVEFELLFVKVEERLTVDVRKLKKNTLK